MVNNRSSNYRAFGPRYFLLFASVVLILLLPVAYFISKNPTSSEAAWYSTGGTWDARQKITIDNTKVSGTSDLTNFPVMISSTIAGLTVAQTNGEDILFTSSDGTTKLDHEIESFDQGTGALVAWVEIPTLAYNADTDIYIYYGNAEATNQENITGVWNTDYKGVWHLSEGDTTSADAYQDSTSTNSDGTLTDADGDTNTTTQLNGAMDFNGDADYINFADNAIYDITTTNDYTWSFWINPDSLASSWQTVFSIAEDSSNYFFIYAHTVGGASGEWITTNGISVGWYDSANVAFANSTDNSLTNTDWYHVVVTYDASEPVSSRYTIFVNGANVTDDHGGTGGSSTLSPSYTRIAGNQPWGENFDGMLDEIRFMGSELTADWVVTEFNNQDSPGTFYSITGQETNTPIAVSLGQQDGEYLPDALIAHWKFDENNGSTAFDSTGEGNNGTITNATWSSGKFGSSLHYDGSGDWTNIYSAGFNTDFDGNEGTVSMWIKPTNAAVWTDSTQRYFINLFADSNNRIVISKQTNDNQIGFFHLGGGTTKSILISNFSPTEWTHLALTYSDSGDEVIAYVNGEQVGTTQTGVGTFTGSLGSSNTVIGAYQSSGDFFIWDGSIDDVRVYTQALTPGQIKIDMNANSSIHFGGGLVEKDLLEDTAGNDPIAHWAFDENAGTGTTVDKSGNGYNGTLGSGAGADSADPSWTQGKYGSGLLFDGSDDYVNMGDVDALDLDDTADATIMGWFYRNATGFDSLISKSEVVSETGYQVYINSSNELEFNLQESLIGDDFTATTDMVFDSPGWHHFVVLWDQDSDVTFYIDGKEATSSDTGGIGDLGSVANNADFRVGSAFDGRIDDLKFFDYLLTPGQIAYEYNRGQPIAHWRFDECEGTVANDCSGNGYVGTITVGATGTYTSAGTCSSGTSTEAWNAGTTGKYSSAFGFDGTDDYIDGTSTAGQHLGEITVSAWINTSTVGGGTTHNAHGIVTKYTTDTATYGWKLGLDNSGQATWLYYSPSCSADHTTGTSNIADGNWHSVAGVKNSSGLYLYVDGQLENADETLTCSAENNSVDISIGKAREGIAQPSGENFAGLIDDVRVYNYGLSKTQISQVMNNGSVRFGN